MLPTKRRGNITEKPNQINHATTPWATNESHKIWKYQEKAVKVYAGNVALIISTLSIKESNNC